MKAVKSRDFSPQGKTVYRKNALGVKDFNMHVTC